MSQTPAEKLAHEIAREAGFLPERQRAWLLAQLRKDFEAYDSEEHRTDRLNQKMSEAVESLVRVAQHFKLEGQQARLSLTMREFDAAPKKIRQSWTARRVADAVRGSWGLSKAVAFTNESLPVGSERKWERRKDLTRKRREGAFIFTGLKEWLDSNPARKLRKDYQEWAAKQNKKREAGRKPLLTGQAIQTRWPMPWAELISAVEAGHLPGEENKPIDQLDEAEQQDAAYDNLPAPITGLSFNNKQLVAAREAKGWTTKQLAELSNLNRSNLNKIELGEIRNPSFTSVAALALALEVPLDSLIITSEN